MCPSIQGQGPYIFCIAILEKKHEIFSKCFEKNEYMYKMCMFILTLQASRSKT